MNMEQILKTNKTYWDSKADLWFGTTALPTYGVKFVTEDDLHLFGDVSGKKLLEICCGSGHSLKYHADKGAAELWGVDISHKQLENADAYLKEHGYTAKFICSPMEAELNIPTNYFDFVYSIYGIGWTTDLQGTFRKIASYLRKNGIFIFSWSHPIHKCVAAENNMLVFKKSYFDESWYSLSLGEGTLTLSDRKLSTYVNALAKAGFVIEQMIEESDGEIMKNNNSDFAKKGKMLPVTFVFKARKL